MQQGPSVTLQCKTWQGQTVADAWQTTDSLILPYGLFNPGITPNKWWIKTKVYNRTAKPANMFLLPNNPHINRMKVYVNGADTPVFEMGDFYPFFSRPHIDRDLAIPLYIDAYDSVNVLLWVDKPGETLIIESEVLDENALEKKRNEENITMGFIMGWMAIIWVFAIFFWRELKQVSALIYAGYLLMLMLWLISHWGIGFQYLWPESTEWASKSRPVFNLICNSFFAAVVLGFFPPVNGTIKLAKYLKFSIALQLLLALAFLVYPLEKVSIGFKMFFLYVNIVLSLFMILFIITYLWKQWRAGTPLVGFYFLGIGFLLLITLLLQLDQSGISIGFPAIFYNYGSALGLLGETGFITLGFARRAGAYKSEKEQLTIRLLKQEKSVAEQIIEIQEQTLRNISQEIHDNMGQRLGLVKLQLYQVQIKNPEVDLLDIKSMITASIAELRDISRSMHPERIGSVPLKESLEIELRMVEKSGGISIHTAFDQTDSLSVAAKVMLFRVFQELLNNTLKHARATEITVSFKLQNNHHILILQDNGIGLAANAKDGIGFTSMRNRIGMLGGKMEFERNDQRGTTVIVSLPV